MKILFLTIIKVFKSEGINSRRPCNDRKVLRNKIIEEGGKG